MCVQQPQSGRRPSQARASSGEGRVHGVTLQEWGSQKLTFIRREIFEAREYGRNCVALISDQLAFADVEAKANFRSLIPQCREVPNEGIRSSPDSHIVQVAKLEFACQELYISCIFLWTASNIESLLRVLNALEKSNFIRSFPCPIPSRYRLVACIAASAPPLTPTPSWKGDSSSAMLSKAYLFAHFAAILLHPEPTAIGRTPPSFFARPMRLPPKRSLWTDVGHTPRKSRFVNPTRASANGPPGSGPPPKTTPVA